MIRKTLAVGIVFLFIIISLTPMVIGYKIVDEKTQMSLLDGNTIYVDDDFNETTPGWNVTHFAKISDAIKAATDGDTIFVYKGTYSVFTVNKNLTIIGESREETVVKANEIKLKSNGIKLTNFTLKGKTQGLDNVLVITGSYCDISYCTITPTSGNPFNGIEIGWCAYTNISNCDIIGFNYWAITLRNVNSCYFENCTIGNSYRGIFTLGDRDKQFYLVNCELYNCGWDPSLDGASIFICDSDYNYVINCDIHDNARGIDIYSSNRNEIIGCNIYDNKVGCILNGYAPSKNKIILNNIYYNERGLEIHNAGSNNYIYHNNFVGNIVRNGYNQGGSNFWDDGYPSGGNYWDDYTGEDTDGDGIGDTAYYFPENGIDYYPLIDLNASIPPSKPEKPSGNTTGKNGIEYTYSSSSKDPNSDQIFYNFSWGEGNYSGWMGPYHSAEIITASHAWPVSGKYQVKVIAKDEEGLLSSWSDSLSVYIGVPNPPTITGPTTGTSGVEYNYTFVTIDPDGDDVWYYIGWGDSSNSGWLGPYNSGEEVVKSHTWDGQGEYTIRAKARDIFEAESGWGYLEVTMPVNQHSYSFPLLQRLLERFPNAFPILRNLLLIE